MKRLVAILVLIALLCGVCVVEEIFLKETEENLTKYSTKLYSSIELNSENLNIDVVKTDLKALEEFWEKEKSKLSFFTNYDKIKTMDESLVKLKTAIVHNDKALAFENISLINAFPTFLKFFAGFNISNLF